MTPLGVHHVSINVRDAAESIAFYTEVLGMATRDDRPDFAFGIEPPVLPARPVRQPDRTPRTADYIRGQTRDVIAATTQVGKPGMPSSSWTPAELRKPDTSR